METIVSLQKIESEETTIFSGVAGNGKQSQETQEALQKSEEKYRLLVENTHEGIFIDQDGVIKFPNPRTEKLTGYLKDDLERMPFIHLVHPDDKDSFLSWQEQQMNIHEQSSVFIFRIKNKKGQLLWIEMNSVDVIWEGKPAVLNFLRDITENKKFQVQLLQAKKMEALGTLAGGVAHDFNNLLMGIQGNTSLLDLVLDKDNPHRDKLSSIEKLVKDGADLTKQLLGVARGGKYEILPTNINRIIEKSSVLFGRTRKDIIIHKIFEKNLWTVEVDRNQIERVLLNLYVNAWHAMPDGGDLYIETKNVTLDYLYTKAYGIDPGKYIKISVTDNGTGMDENTQKRVFDPFFTTKEMGKGTGLGLASAYGIIRNHNGIINVYSEMNHGSTFNIYLPVSEKKIPEENYHKEEILSGNETILFVDDEDAIIKVSPKLLQMLGYHVVLANNGKDAVTIYTKDHRRIDLIILDMIMPGMSGGETFDRLKEVNSEAKVLLSSGYSLNGQAERILERGCSGFIQKPFNMEELSKKIREVLDK